MHWARVFNNPATRLSGGPKAMIEKLARAPREFAHSPQGTAMATKALETVEKNDPEQADVFFTELVMLGYAPRTRKNNPRKKGADKVQVVVAWTTDEVEVAQQRRTDLGERPILRDVKVPHAVMWLRRGGPTDIEKAETYARQEGYRVFTYPTSERDPLGRAKRDVLR